MVLEAVIYKEGGHYVAQCLNVDVSSFGPSEKDAKDNLQEALELYFEDTTEPVASVESPRIVDLTLQRA